MNKTVSVGGIQLIGFDLPGQIGIGGDQAIVAHKTIGGKRVIDAMGPDDDAIVLKGQILDENAELRVFQLDLMRRSGREVQVLFATRAYRAVVSKFKAELIRPYLYSYSITCEIIEDQILGDGGKDSATLEQQVAADLAAAQAYAEGRDAILFAISIASTAIRAAMGDRGALRGLTAIAMAEAQGAVGAAVFEATGEATAANIAVGLVGGVGGMLQGGDPASMAVNFLATTVSAEAANSAGLVAANMTRVQSNIAEAPP